MSVPVHPKHCNPATHIFQATVGLPPAYSLTKKPGKFAAIDAAVIGNKALY
jgi:hypothetical protein